jgi:RNA polymerase sigma-70 factor (ECF subfamily)
MKTPCTGGGIAKETLVAWKMGRTEAFERIVKATMRQSYAIALGLLGNEPDAKDASQEAYIAAHAARRSFDVDRPFYPWFYRILRNRCLSLLEKRSRHPEVSLEAIEHRDETEISPERIHERRESAAMVWKALFSLSPEHREIIVLRSFQELSYREIARVLEISEGTVMSRLFYARRALREALGNAGGASNAPEVDAP